MLGGATARRSGHGLTLVVCSEAGVGKSALLEHAVGGSPKTGVWSHASVIFGGNSKPGLMSVGGRGSILVSCPPPDLIAA